MKRRRNSGEGIDSTRGESDSDMLRRILEAIDAYVQGKTNLNDLEDWFVVYAWNVSGPVGNQTPLEALAGELFLRFAENSMGHLPEQQLRVVLKDAAENAKAAAASV
jgi:hypothetical protein